MKKLVLIFTLIMLSIPVFAHNTEPIKDELLDPKMYSEKIENGKKIYGIFLSELENKNNPEENSIFILPDYDKTYDILKFLYENAIGAFEFKDIINELHVQ